MSKKTRIHPAVVPLFRIENLEVISMLGLKPKAGFRYSYEEINNSDHPEYFRQFTDKIENLSQALQRGDKVDDLVDKKALELASQLKAFQDLSELHNGPGIIPATGRSGWLTFGDALDQSDGTGQRLPEASTLFAVVYAYAIDNAAEFNKELAAFRKMVATESPAETGLSGLELFLNDCSPFYYGMFFYLLAFILCCLAWIGWSEPLQRAAFYLAVLMVIVHTWALCVRMYIMGRPPVTNLYSSAVFIGWGCVVLCLVLEKIYRNGFGTLVASLTGFLTLFVAMYYLDDGDTLKVLEPVLNTTFWLATHVTTVTLGYTATFVAGFIGMGYIFFGVLTRLLNKNAMKTVANMIYGVVCFATLLSFVGTVLGGIWADQSWGRFWGWDSKENGALLIVIWNALILHARWGGLVKDRGIALLSVVGNMVTGWSWFGTNQLQVGLHSYGFNAAPRPGSGDLLGHSGSIYRRRVLAVTVLAKLLAATR